MVLRELRVIPSTRVSHLELYCEDDEDTTVLKDREKVEWEAGDVLENLYYRLYDEGGREVPLTDGQASRIKVFLLTFNHVVHSLCIHVCRQAPSSLSLGCD